MKKIAYLLTVASLVFTLFSCDQEIHFPYEGKDRVQFKHFDVENQKRVYFDSTTFSFGLKQDDVLFDTLKVVVELMGNPSEVDRKYNVEVIADSSTAVEGIHYKPFSREQIFKAKKIRDTLRIVIIRENLDRDYTKPVNKRLDLKLMESKDFELGLSRGLTGKFLLNDFLSEPKWWGKHGALSYYHPKKWRILMQYNELYANAETCKFNQNNEGGTYASNLSLYLNRNIIYDYVDGKKYRIGMYEMTLVEE